jgi:hypothetical protein
VNRSIVGGAVMLAAGCGLSAIGEALSSNGPSDDGGTTDADTDTASLASDSDSPADAGGPAESSVDADGNVSSGPWCKGMTHKLCLDFDDGTFGAGTVETSAKCSVGVGADAAAPPSVLAAECDPPAADNHARINYAAIAASATAVLEMNMNILSVDTTGNLTHLFTVQDTDSNVFGVRLSVDTTGNVGLVTTGTGGAQSILRTRPVGWFHVKVVIVSGVDVTVTFDNDTPFVRTFTAPMPANVFLKLGLVGATSVAASALYDDVRLD